MENIAYIFCSIMYMSIMIVYFHIILCQKDKIKSLSKATDKKVKCISLKTPPKIYTSNICRVPAFSAP